jgi:hypothetical protein
VHRIFRSSSFFLRDLLRSVEISLRFAENTGNLGGSRKIIHRDHSSKQDGIIAYFQLLLVISRKMHFTILNHLLAVGGLLPHDGVASFHLTPAVLASFHLTAAFGGS